MSLCLCGALLLLGAPARAQLDASCTVTVNGQTVQVNPDGSFGISNVAAPDLFGAGGPGSAPDFLSDDVVRVVGTCTSGGQPVYVVSECFRITQGETFNVGALTFTNVPPQTIASITAAPGAPTLTAINQTTPINVMAAFTDGTSGPLSPTLHCHATFRTSNPNIVSVAPDPGNPQIGVATAKAAGTALITASAEGATAVTVVTVSLGDPLTTVTGIVQSEAGDPVNGATIRLFVNGMVISGMGTTGGPGLAPGQFMLTGVASQIGPISAYAEATIGGQLTSGVSLMKPPMPGGFTDAGLVTLDGRMFWITNANGIWQTGSNWISGAPPTTIQTAVIDVSSSITVTHSTGTNSIAGLQSQENFALTGGTFSLAEASFVNGTFAQSAGTLSGVGTLTVNGPYSWTGGTMDGGGTTLLNAGMSISGNATKALFGRTLTNANNGTITWTGSGILSLASTPVINNQAGCTFDVQTDADSNGSLPFGAFNNSGTLRKSAGSGVTTLGGFTLNNSGSVEVEIGTLQVQGGTSSGAFVVDPGATFEVSAQFGPPQTITGSVTVPLGGTLQFSGGPTNLNGQTDVTGQIVTTTGTGNFDAAASMGVAASSLSILGGGTLSFAGPASASSVSHSSGVLSGAGTLTVTGPYSWTGGTLGVIGGGGTTLLNAGMSISGNATKSLFGRTLTNANNGTITWTGSGSLSLASGTISNQAGATFEIQTDADIGGGLGNLLNNAGTFRKSAGTATPTNVEINVNNMGLIEVTNGTLNFQHIYTQTSGSTVLAGGSIIQFGGFGSTLQINGGTIGLGPNTSTGTITANVTLGSAAASTVPRPGAAGTLTISGAYTQNAGTLDIELGGTSPGSGFDQLIVGGTAALSGTLKLTLINGFTPTVGQQFTIVTAGSRTGTFSSVALINFPPNLGASVTYNANSVVVTITNP
ncbi:MAG TPA: hypothetical protein VGM03_10725 [Phycisphaerae bacterium]